MEFLSLLYALLAALVGFQPGDRVSAPFSAQIEASAFEQHAADDAVAVATAAVALAWHGMAAVPPLAAARAGAMPESYVLTRRFGFGTFAILRE